MLIMAPPAPAPTQGEGIVAAVGAGMTDETVEVAALARDDEYAAMDEARLAETAASAAA